MHFIQPLFWQADIGCSWGSPARNIKNCPKQDLVYKLQLYLSFAIALNIHCPLIRCIQYTPSLTPLPWALLKPLFLLLHIFQTASSMSTVPSIPSAPLVHPFQYSPWPSYPFLFFFFLSDPVCSVGRVNQQVLTMWYYYYTCILFLSHLHWLVTYLL